MHWFLHGTNAVITELVPFFLVKRDRPRRSGICLPANSSGIHSTLGSGRRKGWDQRSLYHTCLFFSIYISKHSCTFHRAPRTQCVNHRYININKAITSVKFELKSHHMLIYLIPCIYLITFSTLIKCQWKNFAGQWSCLPVNKFTRPFWTHQFHSLLDE